jgi:hypothetical protein
MKLHARWPGGRRAAAPGERSLCSRSKLRSVPRRLALFECALALALALTVLATPVGAQSLSEVVEAARGYDATYLGTRSATDAARYRYDQALALHLPSANLVATGGRQTSETCRVTERAAQATQLPMPDHRKSSSRASCMDGPNEFSCGDPRTSPEA